MSEQQVERAYKMIEAKRRATRYVRSAPLLVEEVPEI